MGGVSFEYKGKTYDVCLEGGCIPFGDDEDVEAFHKWIKETPEGREWSGYAEGEDEEEEYADYLDEEDHEEQNDDDYNIDYSAYEKCRFGCYRQFLYDGKHDCAVCGVISCKQCARGRRCTTCNDSWICSDHKHQTKCPYCIREEKQKEAKDNKKKEQHKKEHDEDDDGDTSQSSEQEQPSPKRARQESQKES